MGLQQMTCMDIVYVVVIQKGEEAVGEDESEEGQSSQHVIL
jgi:hypothetical protein